MLLLLQLLLQLLLLLLLLLQPLYEAGKAVDTRGQTSGKSLHKMEKLPD